MTSVVTPPAVEAMVRRLTLPFTRGSDLLPLAATAGASSDRISIAAYDFAGHEARFGRAPDVSYVVRVTAAISNATALEATFTDPAFGGGTGTATVPVAIPDSAGIGDTFAVPSPAGASAQTRLAGLREIVSGPASTGAAITRWEATALLGTMARLIWVLGAERDSIRAQSVKVATQRGIGSATGASLDLLGSDLAVPRFPPTPYAYDTRTVALYHLDDEAGATPAIADATGMFPGRAPHPGVVAGSGVSLGAAGRYGRGIAFAGAGSIVVAASADFDIAAGGDGTVECFVRPDPAATDGQLIARRAGTGAGWAFEIGDLGTGVATTVRVTVSDGTSELPLVSVASLPTSAFTHLALVVERATQTARLFVNGTAVATADSTSLGAIANTSDLVIGPGTSGFRGIVDEVRISSVARPDFSPALGEADDHYRRRLALFRRWCLPTPSSLQDLLNELIPTIDGIAAPFVVDDTDAPMERGHRLVRVWPVSIAAGATIDRDGRDDTTETDLWTGDEESFDPGFLGRHANPGIIYAAVAPGPGVDPTLPLADPHRLQPAVAAALDRLAGLVANAGFGGLLTVVSGYDPVALDSRRTGRAVVLILRSGNQGRLAAMAHRAGFDFVACRPDGTVYAACAPGLPALLGPTGSPPEVFTGRRPELVVGDSVTLTTQLGTATYTSAPIPVDADARFWVTPGGGGGATIASNSPASPTAVLTATASGTLLLSADIVRAGRTQTVTTTLVVRPASVPGGSSIGADGTLGVGLDVVGPPEDRFDPVYLVTHVDARVTYGPAPADHQMQRGMAALLDDLLDQLQGDGLTDPLNLMAAYDPAPGPASLANRGRLLRLRHPALTVGELAVRAHRVGFGYVANDTADAVVAGPASDPVGVTGPDEVMAGEQITLTVDPLPSAIGPAARLGWSTGRLFAAPGDDTAGVALTTTTDPSAAVIGQLPGVSWMQATLRSAGDTGPYAFTVRLRPELANARISLDDYYLLMNAINTLNPIGVEVLTESIRSAVVELGTSPDGLDPSFTYPAFRLHRAAAGKK